MLLTNFDKPRNMLALSMWVCTCISPHWESMYGKAPLVPVSNYMTWIVSTLQLVYFLSMVSVLKFFLHERWEPNFGLLLLLIFKKGEVTCQWHVSRKILMSNLKTPGNQYWERHCPTGQEKSPSKDAVWRTEVNRMRHWKNRFLFFSMYLTEQGLCFWC